MLHVGHARMHTGLVNKAKKALTGRLSASQSRSHDRFMPVADSF